VKIFYAKKSNFRGTGAGCVPPPPSGSAPVCESHTLSLYEEFEDTKGVIKRRKSKKDRQYNGQMKKDKNANDDLQNITQKTKD
jgi:hypothetical protein